VDLALLDVLNCGVQVDQVNVLAENCPMGRLKSGSDGAVNYFVSNNNVNSTQNCRVQCHIESHVSSLKFRQSSNKSLRLAFTERLSSSNLRHHTLTLRRGQISQSGDDRIQSTTVQV
jgi:hypothetical protein